MVELGFAEQNAVTVQLLLAVLGCLATSLVGLFMSLDWIPGLATNLMLWSRRSRAGGLYFDELEVRQVEDMLPQWPGGRREFVIRNLKEKMETGPPCSPYGKAIKRLENPRRPRNRRGPADAALESQSQDMEQRSLLFGGMAETE
jgi:hypothetical protein